MFSSPHLTQHLNGLVSRRFPTERYRGLSSPRRIEKTISVQKLELSSSARIDPPGNSTMKRQELSAALKWYERTSKSNTSSRNTHGRSLYAAREIARQPA